MSSKPLLPTIETADIDWQQGLPVSRQFGDVYFSREDGLSETNHVFVDNNQLRERFSNLSASEHFVVAETGFGTGLNFLVCWQAWEQAKPDRTSCLHFISVERYPLTKSDLEKALSQWPELAPFAEELIEVYPPPVYGTHRRVLGGGRIRLTLVFGDVRDVLDRVSFKAHAWFLDGFAPARNPDMWAEDVISLISRHSHAGATLATFTASGQVRRALIAHGFDVTKVGGFGRKRDMITAVFRPPTESEPGTTPNSPKQVVVIGSGIAGTAVAANLAQRGVPVTLLDRADDAAAGASGNAQGAVYVKLGVEYNDQTALALQALTFSQSFYRTFNNEGWHQTGLLQLAHNDAESKRQEKFLLKSQYPEDILVCVSSEQATALAGVPVPHHGLWFPASGWLNPAQVCASLIRTAGITHKKAFEVRRLERLQGRWNIESSSGDSVHADIVVVCAGHETPVVLWNDDQLRLKPIRGQVTMLAENQVNAPNLVLCGPGYVNPVQEGHALVGATFDLHESNPDVKLSSHRDNLAMIEGFAPQVLKQPIDAFDPEDLAGRVSFRSASFDYQPVAGPLFDSKGDLVEGMYLLTGLGSKGLTYAPLMAEFLADQITDQPECLDKMLKKRVASQRLYRHQPK